MSSISSSITKTISTNWYSYYLAQATATSNPYYIPAYTSSSSSTSSPSTGLSSTDKGWIITGITLFLVTALLVAFHWSRHKRISRQYAAALQNEPDLPRHIFVRRMHQHEVEMEERMEEEERVRLAELVQRNREQKQARKAAKAAARGESGLGAGVEWTVGASSVGGLPKQEAPPPPYSMG